MTPLTSPTKLADVAGISEPLAKAILLEAKAWSLPGGTALVTNIVEGHKADLRIYPDNSPIDTDNLKKMLDHTISLFRLKVIYAIIPIDETIDEAVHVAKSLGFNEDGVLRRNRYTPDDPISPYQDDAILSLTVQEARTSPVVM